MNQLAMTALKGSLDMNFSPFTISCQIDPASVATLYPGDAVKLVDVAGNTIIVDRAAVTDIPFGFVIANPKKSSFTDNDALSIALAGSVIYLESSAAIARGASLEYVVTGTLVKTNAGVNPICAIALDKATAANQLIRCLLRNTIEVVTTQVGGSINDAPIGAATPSTGAFTTLVASTSFALSRTLAANPGASVIPHNVTIIHSAGAGDCDDLVSSYVKADVQGAGDSGLTAVASASRCYVGVDGSNAVAAQAYGTQAWAKHDGTGAITAMSGVSALVDVNTGNFTASTVNAIHAHIEGAATVTGQFDGVMIEVYPDVTCLDSGLAIVVDSGAVVDAAIRISGAPVCDVKLSGTVNIYSGVAVTRAAARAAAGAGVPIGSIFVGQSAVATTKPNMYIKIANDGADTDWERIVTQAAD
jgi:hypothetical protein